MGEGGGGHYFFIYATDKLVAVRLRSKITLLIKIVYLVAVYLVVVILALSILCNFVFC